MHMMNAQDIANVVKSSRKIADLSQSELAFASLLSQPTISAFEQDASKARIETLFAMLNTLGLDVHIVKRGEKVVINGEETLW